MDGPGPEKELLQRLIKFSNGVFFINPDITLQAFDVRLCTSGDGICQLGFTGSRWPFNQNGLLHLCCEEDDLQSDGIDDVLRQLQFCG